MGTVVGLRARRAAKAPPPAASRPRAPGLSAPDAALMGVMADLLRAVVRDRRVSVTEVSSYEDPRGNGPVVMATIRVFGLAPLTVVAPTLHGGVEAGEVLDVAYRVAERLADECGPIRAACREFPLDPPLAAFEAKARDAASEMTALAAEPRRNAARLRELAGELVRADLAHQLAAALWGAMAAFGQTALWARGEIAAL